MAIYNYDYDKLNGSGGYPFREKDGQINTFCPTPTENDYKVGFIKRYFAQRTNDKNGYIYEISEAVYGRLSTNPFFTLLTLRWKISGTDEELKESNFNSVKIGMKRIPLLIKYLPNLLQFKEKKDLEI
jgi:hypothetical protein